VLNGTLTSEMAYAPNLFLNATTSEGWNWLLKKPDLDDTSLAAVKASVLNFSMITLTSEGCDWRRTQDRTSK